MKCRIVDPDILCELKLAYQARANDERGDASINPVVRSAIREQRAVIAPRRMMRRLCIATRLLLHLVEHPAERRLDPQRLLDLFA